MKNYIVPVVLIILAAFLLVGIPIIQHDYNSTPRPAPVGITCEDGSAPPPVSTDAIRAGAQLDTITCQWVFRPIK